MRKYYSVFFLFFLPVFIFAQNSKQYEIGLPLIRNYAPKEYKASSQNWGLVQDARGVLYFANGDGVLEYDGVHWRIIKIAKDYSANSIAIDNDNRIFVGSTAEFGYLAPLKDGNLKYISLLNRFELKDKKFSSITNIYSVKRGIYFIAGDKLYRWAKNKLQSWRLRKPFYCCKYGDNILVWQKNTGIKQLLNDSIFIKIHGGEYFSNFPIQNILPYRNNRMLIVSKDSGMFLMNDPFKIQKRNYPAVVKFINQADYFIQLNQLIYSTLLSDGTYAFTSMRGGTAIMDSKGALVQILDKTAGVQNDTHNSAVQDKQNALWLSLDNGIARADISSPLDFWNDDMGLKGSVLSITRFKGKIFAGTLQGLFYHNFSPEKYYLAEESANKNISQFEIIKGIKSTAWDLLVIKNEIDRNKNKLLVATTGGVYEVDLFTAKLITTGSCYKFYRSQKYPSQIFVASDDGIKCIFLQYNGSELHFNYQDKLIGFDEEIVNFGEDKEGRIWISTKLSGMYLLEFNNSEGNKMPLSPLSNKSYKFTHFDTSAGVPSGYCTIYKIKNRLVFISQGSIYFPVEKKEDENTLSVKFVPANSALSYLLKGSLNISELTEDAKGNLWMQLTDKESGTKIILEAIFKNGSYVITIHPFSPIPQMEVYSIFADDDNVTWFGGDNGLIKYDGNDKYDYNKKFQALIRNVILDRDSVLFGGFYFKNVNDSDEYSGIDTAQAKVLKAKIDYAYNHLTFEYAAPGFYDEASKKYKVFLEGFDKNWSEWSLETKKEYTNLQPGKYKFHVVAINIFGTQSSEAIYEFEIKSPWYRKWLAYIVYVLSLAFFIIAIIRFSNKRLREAKVRLEDEIKKRMAEANTQKKEIEKEKEKSDKLLLNILPFKIAEELKANGHAKTKSFEKVTVMFTDFKDFTIIAQQLEPQDLIAELNRCFVFFDDVCVRHNIEKIKTVGDSYMCAGGVPIKNRSNAIDTILAAIEIRDFISRLKKEQAESGRTLWKIRIGVHTGPIISGVVGKKKFAYDIWGDTVNTASRLEQTSLPNKINISSDTYELVKDLFICTYRGKIPVKHKGEIDMYFAESIREELSVDEKGRIPNQKFWELYEKLND